MLFGTFMKGFPGILLSWLSSHQRLRLQAQLLNTTRQQTELECQRDMVKLAEWAAKRDMFAGKQAIPGPHAMVMCHHCVPN